MTMKSKDIHNVIREFQSSNYRSILIDGPWGCGKTYQVREFVKENSDTNIDIHYISLFGKESIDEINTELHRTISPKKFGTKKFASSSFNLISKAISPIPIIGKFSGLADALSFSINNLENKNITGNRIIVFDDLERVDDKLSFISLLGYINSLYLSQVRIICLVSTENITNESRKNEFHDFKEKIFDRVHVIDESDIEIIESYFSKYKIDNLDTVTNEFQNNLRLAQKTGMFFSEIMIYIEEKKYDITGKINKLQLVRSCNKAIKICFKNHDKPNFDSFDKDKNNYHKLAYNNDLLAVGENLANGIHNYLRANKNDIEDPKLQEFSERIVKSLIDIFLFRNFNLFDNIFKPKENVISSKDILDSDLFYLSDGNKKAYIDEFIERINKVDIEFDVNNIKKFADILRYTNYDFSELEMDNIVELMFKKPLNEDTRHMDVGDSILDTLRMVPGRRENNSFKKWEDKISKKRRNIYIKKTIEKLEKSFVNNELTDMPEFIEKLTLNSLSYDNSEIINYVISRDFLLPDLSKDMSYEQWSYAHSMANFARRVNKSDEFKNVALKICKENINNYSLIDRFDALIIYKIDSSYNIKEKLSIK